MTLPSQVTGSGRLELARWIATPENPLTARVAANRVWLHLFGRGLVDTPDNFGTLSDRPSHPELLDHLARRFIELGWSQKKLIRAILLSRAYQMSSACDDAANTRDPDNQLLWRMNRRRLEAEAIRDAMLSVSGELDRALGGPLTSTNSRPTPNAPMVQPQVPESDRRSLYLPVLRNNLGDLFQVFDFPDPHVVSGKRHTTTAPTQALFMLNSPFVEQRARAWAESLLKAEKGNDRDHVIAAYERALGRTPAPAEIDRAIRLVEAHGKAADGTEAPPENRLRAWQHFCHALLASTEFRFLD